MASKYEPDIFRGHCQSEGGEGYTQIQGSSETFDKIPSLYEETSDETKAKGEDVKAAGADEIADKELNKSQDVEEKTEEEAVAKAAAQKVTDAPETKDDETKKTDEDTATDEISEEAQVEPSEESSVEPTTIAYVFSVTKCDPPALDAALVLRHSIHVQSYRNPNSGGRYDYKVYALVLKEASKCADMYRDTGFETIVEESPFKSPKKRFSFRKKKPEELGIADPNEFLKLHAFDLHDGNEPIVVLVEPDTLLNKPLDTLFDAIIFDKNSKEGKAARSDIPLERPDDLLPATIDAFITKNYTHIMPGTTPPEYQRGLLIVRRNPKIVDDIVKVVNEKDYVDGMTATSGWGGSGHLSKDFSGVLSYYFSVEKSDATVELNSCRFNHVGMDNLYRADPNFNPGFRKKWVGKCRSQRPDCEDCTTTNTTSIYTVRYTSQCHKPWECVATGADGGGKKGEAIDTSTGNLDHCLELTKLWHQMRSNLDGRLLVATNDKKVAEGRRGKNHKNIFIGHCDGEGSKNYRPLQGIGASLKKIPALYSTAENEEGKEKKAANKEETEKDVKGDKKEAKDTKPSSKLTFPAIPRRDDAPPSATIAYAIPVTTCDPKDSTFLDKVSVLRHSVHQNSIRTPSSASKYDYRMYAIVHKDAEKCRPTLEEAGFVVTVPTSPVDIKAMKKAKNYLAEELTDAIAKDYIQVYAYDLPTPKEVSEPEPIAVLLELDVILFKPLDDLFDAMLLDQKKGKAARKSIPLERPKDKLPNQIDAFFTRWYAHRAPDSDLPAQVQRGFLVVRRNKDAIKDLIDGGVNKKNKFVKGRNEQKHGWGGVGYTEPSLGGLLGYYYDKFKAGTAVELNSCRFNHVGMDNLYRAPPNFNSGFLRKHVGKCRSGQKECEDCTTTDVDSIYVARYHDEQCTKPWSCIAEGKKGKGTTGTFINIESGKLDHCLDLLHQWHTVRSDLESLLKTETGDKDLDKGQKGRHKKEYFEGHCQKEGAGNYLPIGQLQKHNPKLPALYEFKTDDGATEQKR